MVIMKENILTDLQQEKAVREAMQVEKKIIKIRFATISTELPVNLREKRNANEILICCLGFYVTAFVPRYLSSSSVRRVRCEGCRNRGEEGKWAPGGQKGAWPRKGFTVASGLTRWRAFPRHQGLSFTSWRDPSGGQSLFLFFSHPFFPLGWQTLNVSNHHDTIGAGFIISVNGFEVCRCQTVSPSQGNCVS